VVRVAADINFDSLTRVEEKFDPESQVMRSSTVNDERVESSTSSGSGSGGGSGGLAGVAPNTLNETNNLSLGPSNTSKTTKKVTDSQYDINKTVDNIIQSPGGVKRLSAAVFISARMEGTGTNRVANPRSPEEMEKIRRIVQSALGIQEGNDALRQDEITVEEMPFNDQVAFELTQQLEKQQTRWMWIDVGKQVLFGLLAVGVLFFFWRIFQKTPNDSIPVGIPVGELVVKNRGTHSNGASPDRKPGVVTVDVLNRLIQENPTNMTRAIKSWMTSEDRSS